MATYTEFANETASQKVTLVHLHMKRQVRLFTDAGSNIYTRNPAYWVVGVVVDGTTYTEVTTTPIANQFRYNSLTNLLETFSTTALGSKEVILEYRLFLADAPVIASYNLTDTGAVTEYLPAVEAVPGFSTSLAFANNNSTIIGNGNLQLDNSNRFFTELLSQYRFENKAFSAYSWTPSLAYSQAKIIYSGFVNQGRLNDTSITFGIKDTIFSLNNLIPATQFTSSEVIPNHVSRFKKRIFGRVNGMAVQSVSQISEGYSITGTVSGAQLSNVVTGTGTKFLSEISPGDKLNVVGVKLDVKQVIDDEYLIVGEEHDNLFNDLTITVSPSSPWYNTNRTFSVAEHALKRFSTTIVSFLDRSRIQVADASIFNVGDKVVILGEAYNIFRVSSTPSNDNIIVLDRTLSGNNLPVIGNEVLKREVQEVKLAGETILDTDFSVVNVDNTEAKIVLGPGAEQNIAPEFSTPSDVIYTNNSEYITIGTPATQRVTENVASNYIGTSIQLSDEDQLDRFVWVAYEGMVSREFATSSAQNISFRRGEVYFNTGDNNFYGFRVATDGSGSNDGTTGQVELGSNTIIAFVQNTETNPLNRLTPVNMSFTDVGQALKRAIDSANTLWLFNSNGTEWIFQTNQGINTPVQNSIISDSTFTTNFFSQGSLPQLDYDFSTFLKPRSFIRIPTLNQTFQVVDVSSKFAKLSTKFTNPELHITEISEYKNPDYITDTSLVTVSAFGQTEDNTITGTWIKTPTDAIKKVLTDNGLGDLIETTSFNNTIEANFTIGLYTPYTIGGKPPTVTDVVNKCTVSTLGSIGLNSDFKIKLQLLNAFTPSTFESIRSIDNNEAISNLNIKLNPSSLFRYTVSNIDTDYDFGEETAKSKFLRITDSTIQRLTDLNTTQTIDLYLTNLTEVTSLVNRYLQYNQRLNRVVSFSGPLSLQDIDVGDLVIVDFLELENFIGMVTQFTRNGEQIGLTIEDFGGLFEKSASYADSTIPTFSNSSEIQKVLNAYYTDTVGIINNDENTFGNNSYA